ncbi:MAG: peptide ABC transporter substrate-binding protein [Candidatus Eremiobacteraeota bacterium]|nr:peptide ABC transporter substrate-binding protein [Candidatus Eremiobacteraeota bacterium]MBC5807516.1 peptide ABC transporter substrate-binding protein [Candidatus Eremiobacteraeota bacterium]
MPRLERAGMRTANGSRTQATIAALLLIVASLVGCSKVSTQAPTSAGGNPWTKHGVLRIVDLAEPDNLNPVVGNQQAEAELSMYWAAYLFRWSDENQYVPELATVVPDLKNGGISPNGLEITYHLRPNVKWQDGARFGADDVIFTWHQLMNPKNNVASRSPYDLITGIDKSDDHTIVVHLKKRFAPFIAAFFSMGPTVVPILPKHLLAQYVDLNRVPYNNLPIGTGPFRIAHYEKGTGIQLLANQQYWRGPPKIKEIDIHYIPDENTILTQLRTHEADMEVAADPAHAPTLRTIPGIKLYYVPFTSYAQLGLNVRNPILADVRVRRALAYATDKTSIIDKVAHGVPLPTDSDQPTFSWAYNANVARYPFDLSRAGALLDEAGWKMAGDGYRYKNGVRLRLAMIANTGGGAVSRVEAIVQQDWRRIGIDASIKEYAPPILFASYGEGGITQTGKFDVAFVGWANGVDPDDSAQYMCDQFPPDGQNIYHFCSRELDAAEKVALSEYDQAKRKAAYDTIQRILADQVPTIVVWNTRRISAANSDLKNYKPSHAVSTIWNPWEWEI